MVQRVEQSLCYQLLHASSCIEERMRAWCAAPALCQLLSAFPSTKATSPYGRREPLRMLVISFVLRAKCRAERVHALQA